MSVEETYQKLSQIEHIQKRSGMYIGEIKKTTNELWVPEILQDTENTPKFTKKQVTYSPGFIKIFDEVLTNATDHATRDATVTFIKVTIKDNIVTVQNNGQGIPVLVHKKENIWVPELIFGHLLSGSNYDDNKTRTGAGTNGLGIKITNIFSKSFKVETIDSVNKKKFTQSYSNNLSKVGKPKITDTNLKSGTKITFEPDYQKFEMEDLDPDTLSVILKRIYDCVATTDPKISIYYNGTKLKGKSLADYSKFYPIENPIYEKIGSQDFNWEYIVSNLTTNSSFEQISFVNGNYTAQGGKHIDHLMNQIITKFKEKSKLNLKPNEIKDNLIIFLKATISNPTFNSQTKETLVTQPKDFGIKINISDNFINKLFKSEIGKKIIEKHNLSNQQKIEKLSTKNDGKKKNRIVVPNLDDADLAGTSKSSECTLYLTEGLSAKTFVVSGFSVIGRKTNGVFPLKGKMLNTREANKKQLIENAEINNIKKILGLQLNKKYENTKDLRYGKVCILSDQDSVTFDTPILVKRISTGEILFLPIYSLGNWNSAEARGKEYSDCKDYLVFSDNGWTLIKKIMRHKTNKKIYRVNTNSGSVDVTSDHSLLDPEGNKVSPKDLKISDPLLTKDFPSVRGNDVDPNLVKILGRFQKNGRIEDEIFVLKTRKLFEDLSLLKKMFNVEFESSVPTTSGTYKITTTDQNLVKIFKNYFYQDSTRIVPTIILNASKKTKQEFLLNYNKTHLIIKLNFEEKTESAGILYLSKEISPNVKIVYVKTNSIYAEKDFTPPNNQILSIESQPGYRGTHVFDLETENHHFHAGIGNLIVHNTDGIHITSLVLNFFDYYWPELLKMGYVQSMVTPLIKATAGNKIHNFYSEKEFKNSELIFKSVKYFKGLGTSTSKEAKECFSDLEKNVVKYNYDQKSKEYMELAFNKKKANDRKKWLSDYNYLLPFEEMKKEKKISDYINKELIEFSIYDCVRSIPDVIDGLKPSQRKIIYTCLQKNIKSEMKVAQLGALVASFSNYHHGETSLFNTIINLSQNFTGSNNLNILEPCGQFGSRIENGSDHASPRYIFTKINENTKNLFLEVDQNLLEYKEEENTKIEPIRYYPTLPLVLINGTVGIGTGYSTIVYPHNPKDIVNNIKRILSNEKMVPMVPWYRNFKGQITNEHIYCPIKQEKDYFVIDEIPIQISISSFKETLENHPKITLISNKSTEDYPWFSIKTEMSIKELEKELKMCRKLNENNMHLFYNGKLQKFDSAEEILKVFVKERLNFLKKKKKFLIQENENQLKILNYKIDYIEKICDKKIRPFKKSKKELIELLSEHNFPKEIHEILLRLNFYSFTTEEIEKLRKEKERIDKNLNEVKEKSERKMFLSDLKVFELNK